MGKAGGEQRGDAVGDEDTEGQPGRVCRIWGGSEELPELPQPPLLVWARLWVRQLGLTRVYLCLPVVPGEGHGPEIKK